MKNLLLTTFLLLLINASAFAGDGKIEVLSNSNLEITTTEFMADFIISSKFNLDDNNVDMVFTSNITMIQIFDTQGNIVSIIPIGSDGIIFSGGPEGYHGLPGMILELDINEGDVVITATNIKLTNDPVNLPMPKKMKGKQLTIGEFDKIIEDYISDSIEAERNPYWRIRY